MTIFPFSLFPKLESTRLVLRQVMLSDANAIFRLRSNSSVNKYIDRKLCTSIDEARSFIDSVTKYFQEGKAIYWGIQLKTDDTIIGCIAFYNISETDHTGEIGYELMPEHQGKGVMKEALNTALNFAFDSLSIKKIEANVHPQNTASLQLLLKLGFKLDHEKSKLQPELALECLKANV